MFGRMTPSCGALFRLLADDTRLRAIVLMQSEGELCVCEFTHALAAIQPKVSRHLALLREAKVVLDRRDGQWVYYRLHPSLPAWAAGVIGSAATAAGADPVFREDAGRLRAMPSRPDGRRCA